VYVYYSQTLRNRRQTGVLHWISWPPKQRLETVCVRLETYSWKHCAHTYVPWTWLQSLCPVFSRLSKFTVGKSPPISKRTLWFRHIKVHMAVPESNHKNDSWLNVGGIQRDMNADCQPLPLPPPPPSFSLTSGVQTMQRLEIRWSTPLPKTPSRKLSRGSHWNSRPMTPQISITLLFLTR